MIRGQGLSAQHAVPFEDGRFRDGKRFRGGLVFEAHILLYHSTLDSIVIKKQRR